MADQEQAQDQAQTEASNQNTLDPAFFVCVNEYLELTNRQTEQHGAKRVSLASLFAAARFNSHVFLMSVKPIHAADERKEVEKDIFELPIKFKYDGDPPEYRKGADGQPKKYAEFDGPSEFISTPVFADNKLYVSIGQDPEHGEGVGMLSCIDVTKTGDLSGKAVWTFKGLERTISTPAVKDGIVYQADYTGRVFALDANTGALLWKFDTKGHIWASPVVVDGKVYIGNEEGELFILAEGKELKELASIEFPAPVMGTPVVANGVLYLSTHTHLYAFKEGAATK